MAALLKSLFFLFNISFLPKYRVKYYDYTVVPVMNGHPRDQAKVSVHCRWPLIRGNLTLKCVGRGIDNVAVQGRWPLTTQVLLYCKLVEWGNGVYRWIFPKF